MSKTDGFDLNSGRPILTPKVKLQEVAKTLKDEVEAQRVQEATETKEMKWYIAQTISGYESKAKDLLEATINDQNLGNVIDEVFLPLEKTVSYNRGREKRGERKLFPGYLFVHMHMDVSTFDLVRRSTHIMGFLGSDKGKQPDPISDDEVNRIKDVVMASEINPKMNIKFVVGQRVLVKVDPFEGQEGQILEIIPETFRVKVELDIFNRATIAELPLDGIEELKD